MLLAPLAIAPADALDAGLFYLFGGMAALSAVGVVVAGNIVRMAVFLLFALVGVAGIYFLLGAEFLAAVQLVVYVGGTLILIVFGVMLTSTSPFSRFEPSAGEVVIAASLGAVTLAALVVAIVGTFGSSTPLAAPPATGSYPVETLGQALLGDYLLPFELASVLLLVVMIGAAFLAKARRRQTGAMRPASDELARRARMWS